MADEPSGDDAGRRGDKPSPAGGVSTTRITIWIVVGAVGLYMVVSGLIGALT